MAEFLATREVPGGTRITIVIGDLCDQSVDAIVNAANSRLAHGGGVAAAIVRRGGEEIQRESDRWLRQHGLATHDRPALTGAGRLPCRAVIHAVGPVWRGGEAGEDEALATAYRASLRLAKEQGFESLAMPSISTGIFGFPLPRAARIAVAAVADFLRLHPQGPVREVRFVLRDAATAAVYATALNELELADSDEAALPESP